MAEEAGFQLLVQSAPRYRPLEVGALANRFAGNPGHDRVTSLMAKVGKGHISPFLASSTVPHRLQDLIFLGDIDRLIEVPVEQVGDASRFADSVALKAIPDFPLQLL